MGRDIVMKRIKFEAVRMIVLCGIVVVVFSLFSFILFVVEESAMAIFVAVVVLPMIVASIIGIRTYVNPMRARCFKLNPKLLEQADELFSDMIHKDKFVIYSNRIIAHARGITQMAAFEDIISVNETSMSYNFIKIDHSINLRLPKYQIRISVYGKKKKVIRNLISDIEQRCPKILEDQMKFPAKIE